MAQLRADLSRESNHIESGGTSRTADVTKYSPLPNEAGLVVHNKAVISLVAPARWKMFNPTPEDIDKYGLSVNPVFPDLEWGHLYFQLPTHRVPNFSYPGGGTGFAYSLCPHEMNKYLVEGLDLPPLFDSPVRCAYCEEKERLWSAHYEAWDSLGINRKELSKDGYFAAMKQHDILSNTREAARQATASERYVVSIFDHAKFTGKRPMDEGQTAVTWQTWYAPQAIYKGLKELHEGLTEAGQAPYFDFDNPAGVHILSLVKDTKGWTSQSKLKTEYSVTNLGERYQYPAEWLAYLKNDAAYADPSSVVQMLSYEEQRYYITQQAEAGASKNFNRPRTTTVDMGAAQPAPVMPQAAPPTVTPVVLPPQPQAPVEMAPMPQAVPPQPAAPIAVPPQPMAPVMTAPPVPAVQSAGPPVPVLPTAVPPAVSAQPASPIPAVGGAPVPDRVPPVGGPPTERINWDD